MGECSPPTAADYANANASDARNAVSRLEARVEHLEKHLRAALVAIDELRRDRDKCCGGGPQWGHATDCPSLP